MAKMYDHSVQGFENQTITKTKATTKLDGRYFPTKRHFQALSF